MSIKIEAVETDQTDELTREDFSRSASISGSEPVMTDITTESVPENVASSISIGPSHFELLKLIGEGAFGKVIMVRNRLNQELYAMKVISKKLLRKKNNIEYMKSERDILTKVRHPFIVGLSFAFQTEQRLFLVMEFLSGGELFYHLKRRGLIREDEVRVYASEMILALEFLHDMGVVHRDLKPENVLLRHDGHVCITDFGLAKEVGNSEHVRTLCGTSEYMAPEMLLRNGYTKAVDWWSLGALLFEMLAGKPPFTMKKGESQKDLDRKIISAKPSIPSYLRADTASLLKGLLEKDINKRLGSMKSTMFVLGGITALKSHSFFDGIDWKAVYQCQLTPPIDPSSVNYSTNTSTPTKLNDGNVPGAGFLSPDGSVNHSAHFHEEFTKQSLSPSVIEDSLSNSCSETGTPTILSRSASMEGLATLEMEERAKVAKEKEAKFYAQFDYTEPSFSCTSEQVDSYQIAIAERIAKANAKKLKKARKDAARAAELAEAEKNMQMQQRAEAEVQRAKLEALAAQQARLDKLGRLYSRKTKLLKQQQSCEDFIKEQDLINKRIKAASRKLRGVLELQTKVDDGTLILAELSDEQRAKLSRAAALKQEIAEEETALQEHIDANEKENEGMCTFSPELLEELESVTKLLIDLERCAEDDVTANTRATTSESIASTPQLQTASQSTVGVVNQLENADKPESLAFSKQVPLNSDEELQWITIDAGRTQSNSDISQDRVSGSTTPVDESLLKTSSAGKYIPVHLRNRQNLQDATAVPTGAPASIPESGRNSGGAKPVTSMLSEPATWARVMKPRAGSVPLSDFKGTAAIQPKGTYNQLSVSTSAASSSNSSPMSFYSAKSSPTSMESSRRGISPSAKEFVPSSAWVKPSAPILQSPPVMPPSAAPTQIIPAVPQKSSWAAMLKK